MDKRAILRFVNYSTPTPTRASRLANYLQQLSRTEERYLATNYLSKNDAKRSLEIIEKRWNPKGHRSFKQGIISFGASIEELSPDNALDIIRKTLAYFEQYPWLAAIHTNKPSHIHAHFLLGMTSVLEGRKYSQSPRELQLFREHYDKIAQKNHLPLLNPTNKLPITKKEYVSESPEITPYVDYGQPSNASPTLFTWPQTMFPMPMASTYNTTYHNASRSVGYSTYPEQTPILHGQEREIFEEFRQDFWKCVELGIMKG